MSRNAQSEAAAMACLDAFMTAFNARDIKAFEQTFNFPSIRLASNTMRIINKGDQTQATFDHASLKEWDHSAMWSPARTAIGGSRPAPASPPEAQRRPGCGRPGGGGRQGASPSDPEAELCV
jgi:hypothetical protein